MASSITTVLPEPVGARITRIKCLEAHTHTLYAVIENLKPIYLPEIMRFTFELSAYSFKNR